PPHFAIPAAASSPIHGSCSRWCRQARNIPATDSLFPRHSLLVTRHSSLVTASTGLDVAEFDSSVERTPQILVRSTVVPSMRVVARLVVIFLISIRPVTAAAQGASVSGTVRYYSTSQAVSGVVVDVVGPTSATPQTDETGQFHVGGLSPD